MKGDMDEQRFDAALRALGLGSSRRQAIAGAFGALFGGGVLDAAARGNGKNRDRDKGKGRKPSAPVVEGPCGDGSRKDNICSKDTECCTGYCKKGLRNKDQKGRCRCIRKGKSCKA
jgi:hypothetical protein